MPEMQSMIELEKVSKSYGAVQAVKDLTLSVPGGGIFALLGPNGAGKTTTVKLLCGLLAPDAGQIRVAGFDLFKDAARAKSLIGLIPDEPYVYPKLTAWEFLELIAGMYRLDGQWAEQARHYLELFDLSAAVCGKNLLEGFSHGMKQKVVFTSILMRNPSVWLLDEPLVGLDPKSMRIVKELICERARLGAAVLLSTHVLSIAEEIAVRIGIINAGKLEFVGTKTELREWLRSRNIQFSETENLEDLFLKATLK
ncbi:MAG: ABC transporter ATP-binding protein [Elusimicrobia bacterium]|nr:ABC transporter ATP-binding protein [Elusimicrobiota bacterium]